MTKKIKRGYLFSLILLIIGVLLWNDLSFAFLGLAIASFGITLLIQINTPNLTKK